jgi:hypothetical protein
VSRPGARRESHQCSTMATIIRVAPSGSDR